MTSPDVPALQSACDQLVTTATDPAAARALIVQMWALGAHAADDLLTDMRDVAARHAARTGTEMSAADLLDTLGRHQSAAQLREAINVALSAHQQAATDLARAERATRAARAAARLAQTTEHRRVARVARAA